MNKGDKVRIKRDTLLWGDETITEGTVGVVKMVCWYGDYVLVDDLVDVRGGKCIRSSDLEVIPDAMAFKVGDRVKILTSETEFLSDTIGRLGTILAYDAPGSLRVVVDDYTNGEARSAWYYSEEELKLVTEEKQNIEVGDTVKATHAESGSIVQGVVNFVVNHANDYNVDIRVGSSVITLDLYESDGWTFELLAKKKVLPKVGDVVEDAASLPAGTVTRERDFSGPYFRTKDGWMTRAGRVREDDYVSGTIIVYLPPTASE